MIKVNDFASKIFGILKGFKCQLKMFDATGNEVLNSENARRFYSFEPNMMVTLDTEEQALNMSLGNDLQLKDTEKLQAALKNLANIFLYNYQLTKFAKHIQPKDFSNEVKKEPTVNESFSKLDGTKHKSSQVLEQVRLIIHHSKPVSESKYNARSRNIKKIFIETASGRVELPTKNLIAARAIARHVTNGGSACDELSQYVFEQSSRYFKLKEFLKYAKDNKLINESTSDTIRVVKENMYSIKNTLESLSKPKKYKLTKERVLEHDLNSDMSIDNIGDLKDMFTVKLFDSKLNDILPLINKSNNERRLFIEHVTQLSTMSVPLSRALISDTSLVEFKDSNSELSFKLNELKGALKDQYLVKFVSEAIEKINNNAISKFDILIIENILKNSFVDADELQLNENLITKFMIVIDRIA